MQLVDRENRRNFRFTSDFETTVEKTVSESGDIKSAFRSVVLDYAAKAGVSLTEV
jgi:hypothetical protein